jgi:hypothetical protein
MEVAAHVKILNIRYEQTITTAQNMGENSMELIEHKRCY